MEYLGKTSPMVAKFFDQARGGVLFLDEVGALLTCADGDRDSLSGNGPPQCPTEGKMAELSGPG